MKKFFWGGDGGGGLTYNKLEGTQLHCIYYLEPYNDQGSGGISA